MKTVYIIRKVTRRYASRECITTEKAVARFESFAEVLRFAAGHGASEEDIDEITDEIESMGCTGWHGYEVAEYTVRA